MLGLLLAACPADDVPTPDQPDHGTSAGPTDDPTRGATSLGEGESGPTAGAQDTGEPAAWLEVGWGVSEFNAFEGVLPVVVGPQGLSMFSLPQRGAGFYNPPDPGFDNPDMPILQAWVDVEGYDGPGGHFNEVVDYPALFYPALDDPGVLEGPAMWLVIPDGVRPQELVGLQAQLHAELVDANGLVLTDDHTLMIGEVPPPPPGP